MNAGKNKAKGTKVIFDLGANAGIFRLAALAVQHDATEHAFELAPEIAAHLRWEKSGEWMRSLDNFIARRVCSEQGS